MPKEYLPWLETGHCFSAFIKCMQVGPDAPCHIRAQLIGAKLCILAGTVLGCIIQPPEAACQLSEMQVAL